MTAAIALQLRSSSRNTRIARSSSESADRITASRLGMRSVRSPFVDCSRFRESSAAEFRTRRVRAARRLDSRIARCEMVDASATSAASGSSASNEFARTSASLRRRVVEKTSSALRSPAAAWPSLSRMNDKSVAWFAINLSATWIRAASTSDDSVGRSVLRDAPGRELSSEWTMISKTESKGMRQPAGAMLPAGASASIHSVVAFAREDQGRWVDAERAVAFDRHEPIARIRCVLRPQRGVAVRFEIGERDMNHASRLIEAHGL